MNVKGMETPVNIFSFLLQDEEEHAGIMAGAEEKARIAANTSLKNSIIAQKELLNTSGILEIGFAHVSADMALLQQESLSIDDSEEIETQIKELAKIQTGLKAHIRSLKQFERKEGLVTNE